MPWCTARSTREGADTAPLGDSLRGWPARNPAVVKGGGSGADRGPWRLGAAGDRAAPVSGLPRVTGWRRRGRAGGGAGDVGVGLAREGGSVWGGAAVADDLGALAPA